jgi:hypothetical protein
MAGYKLLLDVPSRQPALGFTDIARGLQELITESDPQFAVGIFGNWGSGKSTLMAAIKRGLDTVAKESTVTVDFNAWRYEREEHLIVPLLDSVREALVAWTPASDRGPALKTASTIGKAVRSILAGMSVRFGLPGAVEMSFEANRALAEGRQISEEELSQRVPRSFYHASFAALRDAFAEFAATDQTGRASRRIVVFVDDLDRCLPESALQVLESMKLFFDLPGFIFVVGLDKQIIELAVETKYPATRGEATPDGQNVHVRVTGTDYVKKIFQLPYRLQPVGVNDLDDFLKATYDEANLPADQREELKSLRTHLDYIVRDGAVNPREIKRYINLYVLQTKVDSDESLRRDVMVALQTVGFRDDWYDVYNALLQYGPALVDALRRRAAGETQALDLLDPELTALNPEFLRYVAAGEPGAPLLDAMDLDRYIFSGEAVRSSQDRRLLDAIRALGSLGAQLRGLAAGETPPAEAPTDLRSSLSTVQAAISSVVVAPSIRQAVEELKPAVDALRPEGSDGDQTQARAAALAMRVRDLSRLLLRVYRAGDVGTDAHPT